MATLTLPPPIPSSTPNYRRQKSQFENKPSLLLSAEENNCIFQIIGSTSQTLATAVVRLAFPDQNQSQWQILETGVVCLIRDEESKSYYIEVYSMQTKSAVFSQEIYNEFAYNIFEDLFLSFEGDESMVGLHFADKTECFHFCEALNRKLKRQKRDGRKRMTVVDLKTGIVEVPNATQSKEKPGLTVQVNITYGKTKKPKQKLRKTDIGRPSDFRHIQHVGFDANRGLDFNLTDAEFQAFFDRAGISQNELQDENTRRFIQNFIKQHGGVQAIKSTIKDSDLSAGREKNVRSPSPVPPRRPPPPAISPRQLTPAPEDFDDLPLPPPPPSPPMNHEFTGGDMTPPPPPPPPFISDAPLPPPPPIFDDCFPPPPPIAHSSSVGERNPTPRREEAPRMDLFSQILKGKTLKKVEVSEVKKSCLNDNSNDLACSLRKALEGFRGDVKPSDSESDSDEEWD